VSAAVQAVVALKSAALGPGAGPGRAALPYWAAHAGTAPTLLIHAPEDPGTPYEGAVVYQRRLHDLGVRCELAAEPAAVHGAADRARYYERCLPLLERFLVEVLG
jgi:acetyl esterase/lipase